MNVIESLQNQMKEESLEAEGIDGGDREGVDLSDDADNGSMDVDINKESDGMDEKFNTVAENKENCDVNAEILKAGKDDKLTVKQSTETKRQRVSKRKNACSGDGMLPTKSPVKPVAVSGEIEVAGAGAGVSDCKEFHEAAKADKPKRTYLRKRAGARVR